MRIRKSTNDQVAKKYVMDGQNVPRYHIWPSNRPRDAQGRKSNADVYAISFDTVEEAAERLVGNPEDQIRMQPRHALINIDVIIETRVEEPAQHAP